MEHIKELNAVDFDINSRELTKEEESTISEFIKNYKLKLSKSHITKQKIPKRTISKKKIELQQK